MPSNEPKKNQSSSRESSAVVLPPTVQPIEALTAGFLTLCHQTGATGATVYFRGAKVGDLEESKHPQRADLASCTKSMVALAAFRLQDLGLIDLDMNVASLMPEWTDWQRGDYPMITLRHLLTQRSGLPGNKYFLPEDRVRSVNGDLQFFNQFEATDDLNLRASFHPVQHTPGTYFDYSNPGSQLAAAVLERVLLQKRGISLAEFVRREIFEPLEMYNSALATNNGVTVGYGGMTSTAGDLAQVGLMLLNRGTFKDAVLLSPDSVVEMLSIVSNVPEQGSSYAHLWWVQPESRFLAAAGDRANLLIIFPDQNLVLSRTQSSSQFAVDDARIYERVLQEEQGKVRTFWESFTPMVREFITSFPGSRDSDLSTIF